MANGKFDSSFLMMTHSLKGGTILSINRGCYTINANGSKNPIPDHISINGENYSLNDPDSASRLSVELRPMFWQACTEEAKNSDLYKNYANAIFEEAGINLKEVLPDNLRKLIFNNANAIKELNDHFCEHITTNWFAKLRANDEFFKAVLTNVHGFTKLLQNLEKYKCQDPLSYLQKMDLNRFELILNNHYSILSFVDKMDAIYNEPFFVLTKPQMTELKTIIDNHYDIGELITDVNKLGYEKPFDTILKLSQPVLKKLCDKRYNATELFKCFKRFGETDPVTKLMNLDDATYTLLCDKQYEATQILNALLSQRTPKPIDYLLDLGLNAMTVILNDEYSYSNRIKLGVDLSSLFPPIAKVDSNYKPELTAFINQLAQKPSYTERMEGLNIDDRDLVDFKDCYTSRLTNTPVRLDGDLFDLTTLSSLSADRYGYRINPTNSQKFLLRDIQPAKDVAKSLEKIIETALAKTKVTDDLYKLNI